VKAFISFVLISATALAQTSAGPKVVTFDRSDAEHCKVIMENGKPLLQSSFGGTSVAVGMPENQGDGEFSIYVAVAQDATAPSPAEVSPKHFSALYSDSAHTRFPYFDKARDLDTQASIRAAGSPGGPPSGAANGNSSAAAPDPTHPEVMAVGEVRDTNPGTRSEEETRQLQQRNQAGSSLSQVHPDLARPMVFLRQTTVKQGSRAAGVVFFRKPKNFKLEFDPTATLGEIDIPINGTIFRF
jgi:hypothetical protein